MSEPTSADNVVDFDEWCDQVDAYGRTKGCDFDYTRSTGRECWREMHEDGMTPKEALDLEFSYA